METIEDMARLGIPAETIAITVERMAHCEVFTTTVFHPDGREFAAAYDVSLANFLATSRMQKGGIFNEVKRIVIDDNIKQYMNSGIYIEPRYLDKADIARPVLTVSLFSPDTRDFFIDGHHRLARAIRDKVNELPNVALTEAEESLCRLFLLDLTTLKAATAYEDIEAVALERASNGHGAFPNFRIVFTA